MSAVSRNTKCHGTGAEGSTGADAAGGHSELENGVSERQPQVKLRGKCNWDERKANRESGRVRRQNEENLHKKVQRHESVVSGS